MKYGIYLLVALVVPPICSMEKKRPAPQASAIAKRTKYENLSALEKLPREVQIKIIADIITDSNDPQKALTALDTIKKLNTHFYTLVNGPEAQGMFIRALGQRFFHYDLIKAAGYLNTSAAKDWIKKIIPDELKKKFMALLEKNKLAIIRGNFSAIKEFFNTTYENKSVKEIFSQYPAMIWLIATLLQETQFRKFSIEQLVTSIYPTHNENPEFKEWLHYAQLALEMGLPAALNYKTAAELQELANKKIDITLNLHTPFPALFYTIDPEIISLLINYGALINEQEHLDGNTFLHYLIIADLQQDAEKNQKIFFAIKKALESGANPNIKNNKGQTALDSLQEKQQKLRLRGAAQDPFFEKLIALLKKYGAR